MVRKICDDSRLTMDRESEASVTGPAESGHSGCLTIAAHGSTYSDLKWYVKVYRSTWVRMGERLESRTSSIPMASSPLLARTSIGENIIP
jgi:hypothetical protein